MSGSVYLHDLIVPGRREHPGREARSHQCPVTVRHKGRIIPIDAILLLENLKERRTLLNGRAPVVWTLDPLDLFIPIKTCLIVTPRHYIDAAWFRPCEYTSMTFAVVSA